MSNIDKYLPIVEAAIQQIGIDPLSCRGEKAGQWNLVKGSANVWLDIWHIEREGRAYFQAMAPVIDYKSVANKGALAEEMLQINHQLYGVAFTIYDGFAYIKVIREADGMDATEANAMIVRVGTYADQYDDYLKNKYLAPPPAPPTNSGGGAPPTS